MIIHPHNNWLIKLFKQLKNGLMKEISVWVKN